MAQDQAVEFLFAAHTQGMQDVAKLATAVDGLRKETERLKTANAGLASSTDTVIQNGKRYNNAIDAQSKALRNHRQGVQQLGMQFNDFATSVTTGASPLQAFSQQIGQVGYAMTMMKGRAAAVGTFIAGPWGAAILIGIQAVIALWDVMGKSKEISKEFISASENEADAMFAYQISIANSRKELMKLYEAQIHGKKMQWQQAATDVGKFGGALQNANEVIAKTQRGERLPDWLTVQAIAERWYYQSKYNQALIDTKTSNADLIRSETAYNELKKKFANEDERNATRASRAAQTAANKQQAEYEKQVNQYESLTDKIKEMFNVAFSDTAGIGKIKNELEDFNDMIAKVSKLPGGKTFISEYAKQIEDYRAKLQLAAMDTKEYLVDLPEMNPKIVEMWKQQEDAVNAVSNSIADAFKGMLTAGASWKDGMKGIIQSVIDQLWRVFVVQQIVGFVTNTIKGALGMNGLKASDPLAQAFDAALPGKNANGTQNWQGGLSWVGERGPELVNLPRGSQVIPAHRASQMGGGGAVINVDARGSSDPAAVREQVRAGIIAAAPSIIAAAEAKTVAGLRRPRLGGAMQ